MASSTRLRVDPAFEPSKAYKYRSLAPGHIRILHLQPATFTAALNVKVVHIPLPPESYKATGVDKWEDFEARQFDTSVEFDEYASSCDQVVDEYTLGVNEPVLVEKPGRPAEPVEYVFPGVSREEAASEGGYEALSYAWGAQKFPCTLYIDGTSTLRITKSLDMALRYFRSTTRVRKLWADAICIDQENTAERSLQVAIMAQIYERSVQVLVWLGESKPSDTLAFAAIQEFPATDEQVKACRKDKDEDARVLELWRTRLRRVQRCQCCRYAIPVDDDPLSTSVGAIVKLLQRSWFSRLWVVQEVISGSSTRLYSGYHHACWESAFIRILHWMSLSKELWSHVNASDEQVQLAENLAGSVHSIYHDLLRPGEYEMASFGFTKTVASRALTLLLKCGSHSCQDPRDRIFAMYSILKGDISEGFLPNYSLTILQVYRKAVLSLLKAPRSSHEAIGYRFVDAWTVFSIAGRENQIGISEGSSWPSWLPTLHCLSDRSIRKWHTAQERTCPCRVECSWETDLIDPETLHAKGRMFGEIIDILPDSQWPNPASAYRLDFEDEGVADYITWYERCREFARGYLYTEYLDEQMTQLLTCESMSTDVPHFKEDEFESGNEDFDYLVEAFWSVWETDRSRFETLMHDIFLPFALNDNSITLDRDGRLCIIDIEGARKVGWVPGTAAMGDKLCVFGGALWPFVLREAGAGRYEVIGDAFILLLPLKAALGGHDDSFPVGYASESCKLPRKTYCIPRQALMPDERWLDWDVDGELLESMEWIALR